MTRKLPKNVHDRTATGRGFEAVVYKPGGAFDHSKSFPSVELAEEYLVLQSADKITGKWVSRKDGKVPLSHRWELMAKNGLTGVRASTAARDISYYRSHIEGPLGDVCLVDLTNDVIEGWVTDVIAKGYAPSTVHKAHNVLSKVLKKAVAQGLLPVNPCDFTANLPEIVITEMDFLDFDEVEWLIDVIDQRFAVPVLFAAYTGLRASELFGLRIRNVAIDDLYVNVRTQTVEVRGEMTEGPPKTKAGVRQVLVPESVMDEVAPLIHGRDVNEPVFVAARGGMVRLSNWRPRYWYPAAREIGRGRIDPCTAGGGPWPCEICGQTDATKRSQSGHYSGLRVHDLRHTAVSLWIAEGRSLFEITKMIGQRDSRLIDERYGHLFKKAQDEANRKLDSRRRAARALRDGTPPPDNVTPIRRRRRAS